MRNKDVYIQKASNPIKPFLSSYYRGAAGMKKRGSRKEMKFNKKMQRVINKQNNISVILPLMVLILPLIFLTLFFFDGNNDGKKKRFLFIINQTKIK